MSMQNSIDIFLKWAGRVFIMVILVSLFASIRCQNLYLPKPKQYIWHKQPTGRYEFANPAKLLGWTAIGVASFTDGAVEGFEFDGRTAFERGYGADPHGYWGSQSWRNVYRGGEPANGFKSPWHEWKGATDFYHTADDLRKMGYLTGGIALGIGGRKVNSKWWHYALDAAIGLGISAFAKNRGMEWIRVIVPSKKKG